MTHRRLLPAALAPLLLASAARGVDPSELTPGLVATYRDSAGTAVTRLEPTVAVTLAAGETAHPRLRDTATVTWAGHLNVVRPGPYTFALTAAGGTGRVTVGGKDVLAGPVTLAGGVQPFEAAFTAAGPAARVELWWEGPGFRREPLHHLQLGHLPAETPKSVAADAALERGRLRFEELACVRCHKPDAADPMAKTLADRPAPVLTDVAKRAYAGWLDAWLADPHRLRPNTAMPKLFADTDAGKAERYAVVAYLVERAGGPLEPARPPLVSNQYAQSMNKGEVLFAVAGCAACHQKADPKKPRDDEDDRPPLEAADFLYGAGSPTGPVFRYALGAVGSKTRPEPLAVFLQDPLKTHPAGRMPNMQLSAAEATDLARYLCRTTDDAVPTTLPEPKGVTPAAVAAAALDPREAQAVAKAPAAKRWPELGRRLLVSKGCVNCHAVEAGGKPLAAAAKFPPLADVRKAGAGKGCLSPSPKPADYKLAADESAAVAAFLADGLTGAGSASPVHAARVALKRFNCLNCHTRDGEGGVPPELADRMRQLEKAENADDVRPPLLTGVGHKSRTSWLAGVLTKAQRARPWMTMRMPQYGERNVGFLPAALAALEGTTPDDAVHKVAVTPAGIAAGRALVGKSGMGCISCHDISGIANTGTRGPDLATIDQRVRHEWYVRWLHQPLRMAPGTRMPQAFTDGKSLLTGVLGGAADAQADAMWGYLSLGPGLPLPDGLEPPKGLVVAVKDRPEVVRTFLADAGSRAVAVGYPGGVSVAFAADQCRLSYAWAGNFLDATPVWDRRGGQPAKLLGAKFWAAPPGHPWGLTANPELPPDFLARASHPAFGTPFPLEPARTNVGPAAVGFDGYSLDRYGHPTFRYHLTGNADAVLKVSETPVPLKGGVASGFQRTFRVEGPAGYRAWFLAGTTNGTPRLLRSNGSAVPGDEAPVPGLRAVLPADGGRAVVVSVADAPAGTAWKLVPKAGGGSLLLLKLPVTDQPLAATFALTTWAVPKDDDALLRELAAK